MVDEYEECEKCGQRVRKGYMYLHENTISCEAEKKMKEMEDKGYTVVKHPTLINKLRFEGKTKVAPARYKVVRKNKHSELFPVLGYWVKKDDYTEAMEKYLKDYKDYPKTEKMYENEKYVLCPVENGLVFKKIKTRTGSKSRKRKFRYCKTRVSSINKGSFSEKYFKYEIYTLEGEKFGEEIKQEKLSDIDDGELRRNYIALKL